MILIRQWQLEASDGNACAAALLSFFEYWHNIRIAQAEKSQQSNKVAEIHGDQPTQDTSLWQFHSEEQLEKGILIYKKDAIAKAIGLLVEKGFIEVGTNPNPRYKFDKTRFFLFLEESVAKWLRNREEDFRLSSPENRSRQPENPARQPENRSAIEETTPEVSSKTLKPSPLEQKKERVKTRAQECYDSLKVGFEKRNMPLVWDSSEWKQLDALVKAAPWMTVDDFRRCVANRFASIGVNREERPRKWLGSLGDYRAGPLDLYKHPRIREEETTEGYVHNLMNDPT